VVSVDLRGVDRSAVATLVEQDVRVLGVYPPGDEAGRHALLRWNVLAVVPADASAGVLDTALAALLAHPTGAVTAIQEHPGVRGAGSGSGAAEMARLADSARGDTAESPPAAPEPTEGHEPQGRVVAVWGPTGAPGRSTVAVNLAAELARTDRVLLVDADTYGGSHAQMLAVLDEAPGVAAAVRAADQGTLDSTIVAQLAPLVQDQLQVLTGLPRADRWPELREHAFADVLQTANSVWSWTVVDIGFCLEQDEEISFDTLAPRRNGVALTGLDAADEVLVVGTADPIGLQRLVRAVAELRDHVADPPRVVVTRVRSSAVGRNPRERIREVLSRFGGIEQVHLVPEDREACDAALLQGETLSTARPTSPARLALAELADAVAGRTSTGSRRGGRVRRRRS